MTIVYCGDVVTKFNPIRRISTRTPGALSVAAVVCFLLGGCFNLVATPESMAEQMIGKPVSYLYDLVAEQPESKVARRGGIRKQGQMPNGNWVYIEPIEAYCDIYYEVDPNGIVLGFRAVGENC